MNIVLRSGITIGYDKGKKPKVSTWVHKAPMKKPEFDLEHAKKTFMEAKKSFVDTSNLGSKDRPELRMDPSMLTMFLETCMKLLCDSKAIKGLQQFINSCVGTMTGESCIVWKIGKHAMRIIREMRLTAQVGEYEIDQVILDLGSNTNALLKQTWEHMGRPTLQWSPIQL